jgi:hypothetical protein
MFIPVLGQFSSLKSLKRIGLVFFVLVFLKIKSDTLICFQIIIKKRNYQFSGRLGFKFEPDIHSM